MQLLRFLVFAGVALVIAALPAVAAGPDLRTVGTPLAIDGRPDAPAKESKSDHERSFDDDIAALVFGIAFANARYDRYMLLSTETSYPGADFAIRLYGQGTGLGLPLWVDLVIGDIDDTATWRFGDFANPFFRPGEEAALYAGLGIAAIAAIAEALDVDPPRSNEDVEDHATRFYGPSMGRSVRALTFENGCAGSQISVAFAYWDAGRNRSSLRGWWNLDYGQSARIAFETDREFIQYFADDGDRKWRGNSEAGGLRVAVVDDAFSLSGTYDQQGKNRRIEVMRRIPTPRGDRPIVLTCS